MPRNSKKTNDVTIDVTDVRIYPVKNNRTLLANVGVTICDEIVIYVKLVQGKKDKFISFPSHSYIDGKKTLYKDDVFCLNKAVYNLINAAVITEYEENYEDD